MAQDIGENEVRTAGPDIWKNNRFQSVDLLQDRPNSFQRRMADGGTGRLGGKDLHHIDIVKTMVGQMLGQQGKYFIRVLIGHQSEVEFDHGAGRQDQAGKVIPVVITVYRDKSFDFIIKTPPVAVQILEAAKLKKGSPEPNRAKVATITWDQVKTIAEAKMKDLNAFSVESAMRMVAGTARSMGVKVKGKFPAEV